MECVNSSGVMVISEALQIKWLPMANQQIPLPYLSIFPSSLLTSRPFSEGTNEDTAHYFKLLLHQWLNESLPGDADGLRNLLGGSTPSKLVMDEFHKGFDGRYRCPWLAEQRETALFQKAARSTAAKHANRVRWKKLNGGKPHPF